MKPDRNYYQRVWELVDRTSTSLPEPHRGGTGRGKNIRRMFVIVVALMVVLLAVVYTVDYVVLRYRVSRSRNVFGTVQVDRYYAIHKKGDKTEFGYDRTETQTCVHSLFPHFGYDPCWYAARHKEKRIDL